MRYFNLVIASMWGASSALCFHRDTVFWITLGCLYLAVTCTYVYFYFQEGDS